MTHTGDRIVTLFLNESESREACFGQGLRHLKPLFDRRVGSGELVCVLPRIYARAETWKALTPDQRHLYELRALHEIHPDWVFCGLSAAVAHGLNVSYQLLGKPLASTSSGRSTLHSGSVRGTQVRGDTFTEASGVPVTSLARTAFDCARSCGFRDGTAIVDSALRAGLGKDALLSYAQEQRGRFRRADVEPALATIRFADPRAESGGESIARAAMFELGFAAPELQATVADPITGTPFRADFKWKLADGSIIYGELDGAEKYANKKMTNGKGALDVLRRERFRESRLTVGGASVVRFSPETVSDAAAFDNLLATFGVPKDHEPLIAVPATDEPPVDEVPLEAYGFC